MHVKVAALFLFFCTNYVYCVEKVFFPLTPDSVKFTSSQALQSSQLADVLSAIFGYTVHSHEPWNGLVPVNPLKAPRVAVIFDIPAFEKDLDLEIPGPSFPLENSGDLQGQFEVLAERTIKRFPNAESVLMYLRTSAPLYAAKQDYPAFLLSVSPDVDTRLKEAINDKDLGYTVKEGIFNLTNPGDEELLIDLVTVKHALKDISREPQQDQGPVIVWFHLGGLRPLLDRYGASSYQFLQARRLVQQSILKSSESLKATYPQKAVLVVLTQNDKPTQFIRRSRSLLADGEPSKGIPVEETWNLAYQYSPDFPVVFILIAFTSIVLILSALGMGVFMWNMDPGRDSIIYRMTSQRMKKD